MEDISHDMTLPCSGHVDVSMLVWSVQAAVAVFSAGKVLLPHSVPLSDISARDSGRFPPSAWCSSIAPLRCFLLQVGSFLCLPIVTALIQN